jgi:YidC/Oxa1 family membrane protein insertase
LEQQDLNKRLILALVLSFFVFAGYAYLFPPQESTQAVDQTAKTQQTPSTATATTSANNAAPSVTTTPQGGTSSAPVTASNLKLLATVTSNTFKMSIDELGRISQYELLEDKYQDEEGKNLQILGPNKVKPLEVRFSDVALNDEAFKTPYVNSGTATVDVTSSAQTVTLTQTLSSLTVTKKITIQPTGAYDIDISTSVNAPYFITPGHRPMADDSMYMLVRGALVKGADDIVLTIEDGDAEGHETVKNAKIASAFDRYVASMFLIKE